MKELNIDNLLSMLTSDNKEIDKSKLIDALLYNEQDDTIQRIIPKLIIKKFEPYEIKEFLNTRQDVIEVMKKYNWYEASQNLIELIKATGDIEGYLANPELCNALGLSNSNIVNLIKATGNIERYLTPEQCKAWGLHSTDIAILIKTTENIEKYLTPELCNAFGLEGWERFKLMEATGNIKTYLEPEQWHAFSLDNWNKANLIETMRNPEKYLTPEECKAYGVDSTYIANIIIETGKVEEYLTPERCKDLGLKSPDITSLILETGEVEQYLTVEGCKAFGLDSSDVASLILETGETEKYLTAEQCEKFGLKSQEIARLIRKTGEIEKYLTPKQCKDLGLKSPDIANLIKETGEIEKYLTPEQCRALNLRKKNIKKLIENINIDEKNWNIIYECVNEHTVLNSTDLIYNNLDYILEKENHTDKKEIINKLYEKNNDIVKTDYRILENQYLEILGEEKINLISCYPNIVNNILGLDIESVSLLNKCLEVYEEKSGNKEWTPLCARILFNLKTYNNNFAKNIDTNKLTENEVENITKVLSCGHYFRVKNMDEINNYENIKQARCKEMFEKGNERAKIDAVLLSKLGLQIKEAQSLERKFGKCIDSIENEDLKFFIKSLQEIIKIQDETVLQEIFATVKPVENINTVEMERMLKDEYGKLYYNDLFSIEQAEKNESYGDNVYELPIDSKGNIEEFNMIITSIASFVYNSPDNFYEDWNRPAIASQHFCANYIRRDMMGRVPIPHLCFGFASMAKDSLMLSGSQDIYSSEVSFESTAEYDERYLSPDFQINETKVFNEMDFRRIQDGTRKQPDYIVVFRANDEPFNMDKAQKASKQFEEATGRAMPILIIDEDKCLETERRIIDEMIKDFYESPSSEKYNQISQKIRNNKKTRSDFAVDINTTELLQMAKKENIDKSSKYVVTLEDCKNCYEQTTPEERVNNITKFKALYHKIKSEKREEKYEEQR